MQAGLEKAPKARSALDCRTPCGRAAAAAGTILRKLLLKSIF